MMQKDPKRKNTSHVDLLPECLELFCLCQQTGKILISTCQAAAQPPIYPPPLALPFAPRILGISAWQLTAWQLTLAVAELENASEWQDSACQPMRETLAANAIHPHIRTTTVSLGCCGMTKRPNSSNPASCFLLQESYVAPRGGLCCGEHGCW